MSDLGPLDWDKIKNQQFLAIDYGEKVIGLSTYCPMRDPFPLLHGKIVVQSSKQVLEELEHIISEEFVEQIVLGLPLFTDGKESDMTKKVRKFAKSLNGRFPQCQLHLQDETLSTKEAEERMKSSPRFNFQVDPKQIDAMSASIILEDFLQKIAPKNS
jgi:putative Holliday junction resolvase